MIVLYITKVHGFILGIVIMQVKHFCINNGSASLCKRLYIYMYETKNALMYKYWYPFAETMCMKIVPLCSNCILYLLRLEFIMKY